MILGYQSNYSTEQWWKIGFAAFITILCLFVYVEALLLYLDIYIPWLSFFASQISSDGVPEEISAPLKDPNADAITVGIWLVSQGIVLIGFMSGGLVLVIIYGYKFTWRLAMYVCKKSHLIPTMRLSFKKVKPSKLDRLINWLTKY